MKDYEYMKLALKEAKKAYNKNEIPVGAVLVYENRVVARGHNMKEHNACPIDHAEIIVIKKACGKLKKWRLTNSILYVTLEPCPMCASAIKQSRISKVVYLLDNKNKKIHNLVDDIFNMKDSNVPVEKEKISSSCFDDDDIKMLSSFFEKKRN